MATLGGVILDTHVELIPAGGRTTEALMISICVPLAKVPADLVGRQVDVVVDENGAVTSIAFVKE